MAQTVKLKDGSYIDAEGIYDVVQQMTQKAVNEAVAQLRKEMDMIPINGRTGILVLENEGAGEGEGGEIHLTGTTTCNTVAIDNYQGCPRFYYVTNGVSTTWILKPDGIYLNYVKVL